MTVEESPPSTSGEINAIAVTHYTKPVLSGAKISPSLAKTRHGKLSVNVLSEGGENSLHSHRTNDGFWFVLKGRARFYTTDDVLVAEIGENEGFVTPRGYKYWFEAVTGGVDLELAHFSAWTAPVSQAASTDHVGHVEAKPNEANLTQPDQTNLR